MKTIMKKGMVTSIILTGTILIGSLSFAAEARRAGGEGNAAENHSYRRSKAVDIDTEGLSKEEIPEKIREMRQNNCPIR